MGKIKGTGYITLDKIKDLYNVIEHKDAVNLIKRLCNEGIILPVKSSELTPQYEQIHSKYRICNNSNEDNTELLDEINFTYHHKIKIDCYRSNIKKYLCDRDYIRALSEFFIANDGKIIETISVNERSFELFQNEKFLSSNEGISFLNATNIDLVEDLCVYRTPEPFIFLSVDRTPNQNVLIIENKDTFLTISKMLMDSESVLGLNIGTVIYGEGKKVLSSLPQLPYDRTLDYLMSPDNTYYYWGDIDRTGFAILGTLLLRTKDMQIKSIQPFEKAYYLMINKLESKGLTPKKAPKEQKEKYIDGVSSIQNKLLFEKIRGILDSETYIPQEILNRCDLRGDLMWM